MADEITRVEALEAALNGDLNEAVVAKLNSMIKQLKKPAKRTETKEDRERATLVATAIETIKANPDAICDAKWICENVKGIMSTQKAGAIMRIAIAQGSITKHYDAKGKPYYKA